MVAILTKFIGATNSKGSRVKAFTESGLSVTVSWDHALNSQDNHAAAAKALCAKMDWHGTYVGGGTKTGYAFVDVKRAFGASFVVKKSKVVK